ncbi:MAG: transporter substrate-binding domain-containing protein [Holophagaceae bacterium]|uniref:histidine kinase n=1 Tax=Candidatus Geothrix odensensis TaxID=2954440 RepID=A0A936F2A1_9BACT|nr:transporter substrate-binding domain-containing protein [Candidatus Geothrix odensensis]
MRSGTRSALVRRLLALLLMLLPCGLIAGPRLVRVAVFPHKPATFQEAGGQVRGFYIDMIEEVGRAQGWEIHYVPGSFAESLERARRGEVDLATSVAFTEERAQYLDYGKEVTLTVWSILYANPKVPIQSVFDVRGRRVAVMKSDVNGQHFIDLCRKFEIQVDFVVVPSFEDVMLTVAAGAADAGVTTSIFGYSREGDFQVVRTPVVFNPFPVYFATTRGRNADLLRALDTYLAEGRGKADSGYTKAIDRWMQSGGMVRGLPLWLPRAALALVVLLTLTFSLMLLFRYRVRRATAEVRALNAELEKELVERRRREDVILNVASGVSAVTGDTFFQELTRYLAQAAHADAALIGEGFLKDGAEWVRTLAVSLDGQAIPGFEYPLAGTPCTKVYKGEPCTYREGVQQLFPGFDLLRQLGASAYVGCPLLDAAGRTRGMLAVLKRQPEDHPEETASLLRIFSSRATAELERRAAERERQLMEQQMQHVQKLESLGLLAGGIAHDFNNLLTAMLGHLNLAQSRLSPESPAHPSLGNLERIIHRTAELTRQMLAYSGKGRFLVQNRDLNQVIREMVHLLEVSISKKVALRLGLAGAPVPIQADAAQIQQVLMNLVTNAADAIGDQEGTIRITTAVTALDRAYLDQVFQGQELRPGTYAVMEVQDSGCGMSPEVLSRIFDPFFTTKATGHGLGLSATLGILRGHHAGLRIYSEPGRGSTFKVLFPVADGVADEEGPEAAAPVTLAGLRVLLVDDEVMLRESTSEALQSLGVAVVLAADGQEAVDLVIQQGPSLDLVFMDLTMPRMDGREAFQQIRRLCPGVPVVLTSGYNEQESIQDFIGRGLAGFLQKPYTLKALGETLQRCARRRPAD